MAIKDEVEAILAADRARFRRQARIAVIIYVILEAILLGIFIYKVIQNR